MKENNNGKTPQELRGKLIETTAFGETIFALSLAPENDPEHAVHLGPFEFDRPIKAYEGQQVSITVSAERTELGVFSARMRWLNPKPIDRKGGRGPKKKKKKSPSKSRNRAAKPAKPDPERERKAKLREILGKEDHVYHPRTQVAEALNLSEAAIAAGLKGLDALVAPDGGISTAGVRLLKEQKKD
ncbi:MAG: hypothetical protein AAGN35_18515 [Bacteroidota bacterium]